MKFTLGNWVFYFFHKNTSAKIRQKNWVKRQKKKNKCRICIEPAERKNTNQGRPITGRKYYLKCRKHRLREKELSKKGRDVKKGLQSNCN